MKIPSGEKPIINHSPPSNKTRIQASAITSWLLILFFLFIPSTAFSAEAEPTASSPPMQDPTELNASDTSNETTIRDDLEELYRNYEAIDKQLEALQEDLGNLRTSRLVTPITISVMKSGADGSFRLVSLEVKDNGNPLWNHIYTPLENDAIDRGGRHQFFKGISRKGGHNLIITYRFELPGGDDYLKDELRWGMNVRDEPIFIELSFARTAKGVKVTPKKLHIFDESQGEVIPTEGDDETVDTESKDIDW
jgi:hypothetical protein